jgi:hypothetical protein
MNGATLAGTGFQRLATGWKVAPQGSVPWPANGFAARAAGCCRRGSGFMREEPAGCSRGTG